MIALVLTLSVVGLAIVGKQQLSQSKSELSSPTTGEGKYTAKEIYEFWDMYLKVFIQEELHEGMHPSSTVNEVTQERIRSINERYDNPKFEFWGFDRYHIASRDVFLSMAYRGGSVQIQFFIPALMDEFYATGADRDPVQRHIFDNFLVIGYLHELDHIVLGYIDTGNIPEVLLAYESATWAKTVQSIELLVTKDAFALHSLDQSFLDAWIHSGKDITSDVWLNWIRYVYTIP
tara:strand:+ start:224 stop:922 length:699 start_codon:yes stop_codon:yes gene_type:complete